MKILVSGSDLKDSQKRDLKTAVDKLDPLSIRAPEEQIGDIEIAYLDDENALQSNISKGQILCTNYFSDDLLAAASDLKWIHYLSAGVEDLLTDKLRESDIVVTNSKGVSATPAAEHVFALMLAFSRRLHRTTPNQMTHRWDRDTEMPYLTKLSKKTIGIVGLGNIGQAVAKRADCFGMTVHGIRKNVEKKSPGVSEIASPENMDNLLSGADYVVLALPLTDDTRGIIGPETLSTMKETAILINVSRGEVLQQGPLIEALKEGSIGGAGLDVFKEEPLPEESPLWGMENVIITPHFAGLSDDYLQVALNLFWENLEKYLRGERLINEVDLQTGY